MTASARKFPESVTTSIELVTPEIAEKWLGSNTHNRKISHYLVDEYVKTMIADHWLFTGEAIQFGTSGLLLNGQHRLTAIIRSGVSLWTLIVRDLHDESQDRIDNLRPRRAGDVLALHGHLNYNALASAARLALHLEDPAMARRFSNDEILTYVDTHPDLVAVAAGGLPRNVPLSPSPLVYVYWRITKAAPIAGAEFFRSLETLANLAPNSPVLTLHRRLVAYESGGAGDGWTRREEVVSLVFRAWNAWAKGESLSVLRIPRSGGKVVIPELVEVE